MVNHALLHGEPGARLGRRLRAEAHLLSTVYVAMRLRSRVTIIRSLQSRSSPNPLV